MAEPSKLLYWGIPGYFFVYLFLLVATGIFLYNMYKIYRLINLGVKDYKIGDLPRRLKDFFDYVIIQKRIFSDFYAGLLHGFIFWSFLVLTLAYGNLLLGAALPSGYPFFFANNKFYFFLKDFAGLFVLAGLGMAFYRRYVMRAKRLENTLDALIILLLITFIIIMDFFAEGLRVALNPADSFGLWQPVGTLLAGIFGGLGKDALGFMFQFTWWCHVLLLVTFMVYIPYSKHLHIISCGLSVFSRRLDNQGALSYIDLEDEQTEEYGKRKIEQFSQKDLFDLFSCTECGRCQEQCPASESGKTLSPKMVIHNLKEHLEERGAVLVKQQDKQKNKKQSEQTEKPKDEEQKETPEGKAMVGGVVTEDEVWSCTTCGACREQCPAFIEHPNKLIEMRRYLVLMESKFPSELKTFFKNLEKNSNPWGFGRAKRGDWAKDLEVKNIAEVEETDYLLWVGCAGAFEERNKKVIASLVTLLNKAGVDFAVLGKEEKCCGDSARRLGNEHLFQTLAQENIETLNECKFKEIVVYCPHGYNTLKWEYPQLGGSYKVIHYTELLARLIKEGKLQPTEEVTKTVVYHDSCYLGRYNELYNSPREILSAIPSLKLQEMTRHKEKSFCCGAGGGRMWMEEHSGKRINQIRLQEAVNAKAEILATGCPFCLIMFEDAKKELSENIQIHDIGELLLTAIKVNGKEVK